MIKNSTYILVLSHEVSVSIVRSLLLAINAQGLDGQLRMTKPSANNHGGKLYCLSPCSLFRYINNKISVAFQLA